MTRRAGAEAVYEVADSWRDRCLRGNRSLLWPEAHAWSVENLQRLWNAYIENPDASKDSFYEKWERQLEEELLDVHRVAADLVVIYNLFPTNYYDWWKRDQVLLVSSWKLGEDPPKIDDVLPALLCGGIGNAGMYYSVGRPWQFAFLLKFSQRIMAEQVDPHDLATCEAAAVETQGEIGRACAEAKNIVLHLLFPDHFERIASQNHKKLIVSAFPEFALGEENEDRALAMIKKELIKTLGRDDVDFYDEDIEPLWKPVKPPKPPRPPKSDLSTGYWIEKTNVKGRPDRESGEYAVGRALWSPQESKSGGDIYRHLREVRPGDQVLHLTDNQAFTGVSVVAGECEEFNGAADTEWGEGPSYKVPLVDYRELDPPLDRETMFGELSEFRAPLIQLAETGQKNLFYNSKRGFNQGTYFRPASDELLNILDDAYESISGKRLTERATRRSWVFQGNPKLFDLEGALGSLTEMLWFVGAYKKKIRSGDRVFIWQSGSHAGVLALATVLEGPTKQLPDEGSKSFYLTGSADLQKPKLRVPLGIDRVLGERVPKQVLLDHPILKDAPIAKGPQGTNFALTQEQARALEALCVGEQVNPTRTIADLAAETGFEEALLERWIGAIRRKSQAILYGPPGTGKTYVAEHLASHLIGGGRGFSELVQFHPSYGYEDFIQGIRPNADEDGELKYEVVPGRFLEFCDRARQVDDTCVLIIDEINRANLSRVFGELMYLLEYRERAVPLAGGGTLSIPENVIVIGTMNTADRSIALVDHALRRRFAFLAVWPDYKLLERYHEREGTGFSVAGLTDVLKRVNQQINDPNYEVGITFFMRPDIVDQIRDIWCVEILPYLEEFFFDQPEKVSDFKWEKVEESILP